MFENPFCHNLINPVFINVFTVSWKISCPTNKLCNSGALCSVKLAKVNKPTVLNCAYLIAEFRQSLQTVDKLGTLLIIA